MKRLMKKLEDIMVAVTFAEAGEYDEAIRREDGLPDEGHEVIASGFKKTAAENAGR